MFVKWGNKLTSTVSTLTVGQALLAENEVYLCEGITQTRPPPTRSGRGRIT